MNTATPRTDAGCAPIFFNNGTSMMVADPEISRQLERELADRNAQITALKSALVNACEPVEKLANALDRVSQLELELAEANRKLEWLKAKAYREPAQWGFCAAQWSIHFCRKDEDAYLSKDFFKALKQCMDDRANPTTT